MICAISHFKPLSPNIRKKQILSTGLHIHFLTGHSWENVLKELWDQRIISLVIIWLYIPITDFFSWLCTCIDIVRRKLRLGTLMGMNILPFLFIIIIIIVVVIIQIVLLVFFAAIVFQTIFWFTKTKTFFLSSFQRLSNKLFETFSKYFTPPYNRTKNTVGNLRFTA